jgi:hypothetical protein
VRSRPYKRLIVGLRVDGWSGRIADQRVDERVRYPDEPDDRVFGAGAAAEAVSIVVERLDHYTGQHGAIRRRRSPFPLDATSDPQRAVGP